MDALTAFVDELEMSFPTADDFDRSSSASAIPWKNLPLDESYRILSVRGISAQHGISHILSLQKQNGELFNAWSCGILSKELLANPSIFDNHANKLFIRSTGFRTSKSGKQYNSYQLYECKIYIYRKILETKKFTFTICVFSPPMCVCVCVFEVIGFGYL